MLYALVIQIGATIYNYDNLSYKDIETCDYHKKKVEKLLFPHWEYVRVHCKLNVD